MVERFTRKELVLPLSFGILFSFLYYILPLKYIGAGILGVIGMVLILKDIRWGVALGAFVIPFLPDLLGLLYMFSLVLVYIYQELFKENNKFTKATIDMPLVLFLLVMLISTITSINPKNSFRDLALHLGGLSFLIVMVNNTKTKEDFHRIITMVVFAATLVGLYGLYQYIIGVEIEAAWVDLENNPGLMTRVYSFFGNPNILAEYLIMTIPLAVSLFWHSKKLFKKTMYLGITLFLILIMLLTQSRGGWIGFAFSAFLFIIFVEKRLLLSIIPLVLGGIYFLPQSILNRILSIGNLRDSSNAYRIKIWDITMDMIRDNWMAGVGFGHLPFKQVFETYIRTMPTFHAHNTYLQTAAETGIPGLIAFLLFIFILFKYAFHRLIKNEDRYIRIMAAGGLSAIGGVLAHGAVENILYLPKIIITFWILVGFILTLFRLGEDGEELS